MKNIDKVLQDCLGQLGTETLKKSIIRLKTNSVADPEELYLPLLVVPRTILSWLIQNILPLKVGEYKDFKFPGQDDTVISVEKLDSDVYRGEFVRDAHVIHRFNHQTLPSISGHLMTVFELYDQLDVQAPKENQSGSMEMMAQIMAMNNIMPKQQTADPIAMKTLDMLGKLIDVLVADKISKDKLPIDEKPSKAEDFITRLKDRLADKKEEDKDLEEEAPMKKDELLMKPKKSYFKSKLDKCNLNKAKIDEGKTTEQKKDVRNERNTRWNKNWRDSDHKQGIPKHREMGVHLGTGGESVSGTALRTGDAEQKRINRHDHSRVISEQKAMPKPNLPKSELEKGVEGASGAAMPKMPKAPTPPTPQGQKPKAPDQAQMAAQGKIAQPKPLTTTAAPKIKAPAMAAPKMAMPKTNTPKTTQTAFKSEGYFKKKLGKAQMNKSEKAYYCNEKQLFKKCDLCLKPEFAKTESTPAYTPCSCFKVTGKDFVNLRKSGDGFLLSFAPTIDRDTIDSFLNILRS